MKLDVLNNDPPTDAPPWYSDGLTFTCTTCGNCCTGGPGFVWISQEEIRRLADHLQITKEEVIKQYCRRVGGRISLKETLRDGKMYDCIFLTEHKITKDMGDGEQIVLTQRRCSIYEVRPLQCRTWPFWPENVESPESWKRASRKCHGMNDGARHFTREQIESLRDAADWPEKPPTSA